MPLDGLNILELGTGVAAPYAGRLLALNGATVAKVEPSDGDPARTIPVDDEPMTDPGPVYLALNAGKRNVSQDAIDLRLAFGWADVVLDSRTRSGLEGSGCSPHDIWAGNPRAVVGAVTAWGFDEADAGQPEDELLVQALSGLTTLTGDPGQAPLRLPGHQSQYLAGAYLAAGILAALRNDRPERLVEVSWLHSATTAAEGSFSRALQTHEDPLPPGSHPGLTFPSGAIRCADGYAVPGTIRQADWEAQCLLYEMPELIEDPRFATREARMQHKQELWDTVQPWYDDHTRRKIVDGALELGWAAGMVLRPADVKADVHLGARQFVAEAITPHGRVAIAGHLALDGSPHPSELSVSGRAEDTSWFLEIIEGARP